MSKRNVQQLLWLVFGIAILAVITIAGRNTNKQEVVANESAAATENSHQDHEVAEADVASIEKPDGYTFALSLYEEAKDKQAKAMTSAALAIDSISANLQDEKLIDVLLAKSEELLNKALKLEPNNVDALNNLALIDIYRNEDVMSGVGKLKKVVDVDPNNENALYQLGILSIKSGQKEKAIERFEKLVSLQPKNKEYHKNLALLYGQMGDAQKAEKHAALAK